jgi:hypothetical protein
MNKVMLTYLGFVDKPTNEEKIAMAISAKERRELIKLRDKLGIPKLKS